jgi:hypothetical protein
MAVRSPESQGDNDKNADHPNISERMRQLIDQMKLLASTLFVSNAYEVLYASWFTS